mmetsp:Transcript_4165/g.8735  ORF Transcript_4165/g.8735 Transcript_4165/m.8735 type:complete len:245 (-) Transcript_4165:23-757(-)
MVRGVPPVLSRLDCEDAWQSGGRERSQHQRQIGQEEPALWLRALPPDPRQQSQVGGGGLPQRGAHQDLLPQRDGARDRPHQLEQDAARGAERHEDRRPYHLAHPDVRAQVLRPRRARAAHEGAVHHARRHLAVRRLGDRPTVRACLHGYESARGEGQLESHCGGVSTRPRRPDEPAGAAHRVRRGSREARVLRLRHLHRRQPRDEIRRSPSATSGVDPLGVGPHRRAAREPLHQGVDKPMARCA